MRHVTRASISVIVLASVMWACVGDDPVLPGASTGVDAGPSSDAREAGDAAPATDSGTATLDAGSDAAIEAGPSAPAARIFATKEKFQGGAFGGIAGADAKCAEIATKKSLAGVYRAWMATESTSAISRIQGAGPWHRLVDDKLVFQNKAALQGVPLDAVLYDEDGNSVAGDANVWTGTLVGGAPPVDGAAAA